MALTCNNNHIIYYQMDAQRSIGLGQTNFASADYLVVQCWVCSTFFFMLTPLIMGTSGLTTSQGLHGMS